MTAARRALAATAVLAATACTSAAPPPEAQSAVRPQGVETVAVTVADGPEVRPTWTRTAGRAVLPIPSDLLFPVDSADLGPDAPAALKPVVDEARAHPDARITVEGHADGDGDEARNQDLSERRARAVAGLLVTLGADPLAITTRGWGETRPTVAETDEAAKARNRRVVVTVTYGLPTPPVPPP